MFHLPSWALPLLQRLKAKNLPLQLGLWVWLWSCHLDGFVWHWKADLRMTSLHLTGCFLPACKTLEVWGFICSQVQSFLQLPGDQRLGQCCRHLETRFLSWDVFVTLLASVTCCPGEPILFLWELLLEAPLRTSSYSLTTLWTSNSLY